ncbi:MAG: PAS domain S-box protein, partial [Chloroflexi bacterium]|nr:PAS domain S-box protein [Chloroflexota bacterium]
AEIGRVISSAIDSSEVYERFAQEVLNLIPFERLAISMVDFDTSTTSLIYVTGMEVPGKSVGDSISLANTLTDAAINARMSILLDEDDMDEVIRQYPSLEETVKQGALSFLTTPLISNDRVVGVMHMRSTIPRAFTLHHQALAERVASQIAGAMAQSMLYADLEKAEVELKGFFDLSIDMLCIAGMDGHFKRVNKGFEKTLGYTSEELLAKSYLEFVHPEDVKATIAVLRSLANGVPTSHFENRFACKDGSYKWLAWTAMPDVERHIMYAAARDITEARHAEEALRDSDTRVRAILNNIIDGIITIDERGIVRSFSIAAEGIFGYAEDEVINKNVSMLMPEPYHSGHNSYLSNYIDTGDAKIIGIGRQMEGRRKDGSIFPMDLAVTEMRLGDQLMFVGIIRDVTEKKQAEEELQRSYEKNRALINAIPDLMFQVSGDGVFIEQTITNDISLLMPTEDFIGKRIDEVFPEDVAALCMNQIAQALQTIEVQTFVYQLNVDEKLRDFEARVAVSGQDEVLLIVRDISERLAVERMKEEFISVVSHELRTPLTSIRGSLGLMAGGVLGALPEKAQHMMEIAANNTDRLVRLINDILDIERMESGKVIMEKQECDAADLVDQAIEIMQGMADKAEVSLSVSCQPAQTWADSDRIIQVLTNLISNAIKFSPQGSTVSIFTETQDDNILFKVEDQGRGIPADKLESVFGRFQQVDASDAREKGGTGLGLAICKKIIEQHDGKIWVESTHGEGSVFYFSMPIINIRQ